jgi:hypothetical protein
MRRAAVNWVLIVFDRSVSFVNGKLLASGLDANAASVLQRLVFFL